MRRVVFAAVLLVATRTTVAIEPVQRTLTFEDRVKAQEAIERVYYSHQIGATKQFEDALPRAVLENKVRTYVDQTAALDVYWKTPVTGEMLQRELERMASGARMPERLLELYAALGNDPFLIKECLARAALVGRLSHNFYAFDSTLHAEARQQAMELRRQLSSGELSPAVDHPNRSVLELVLSDTGEGRSVSPDRMSLDPTRGRQLRIELSSDEFQKQRLQLPMGVGQVSAVREERDLFVVDVLLSEASREIRAASYVVPKIAWDQWWATSRRTLERRPDVTVADERDPVPLPAATRPVGASSDPPRANGSTSGAHDVWDDAMEGLPDGRFSHTSVWTGSLMVVWGGQNDFSYFNTGGRYDPATDVWTPTSTTGAPSGRSNHAAVWTGSLMVIWGGTGGGGDFNTGGKYDPLTDFWTPTSTTGTPAARNSFSAVWTGNLMVVWGGYHSGTYFKTGGRYDPVSDSWSATSTTGAPSARMDHKAVWTGSVMVAWGGRDTNRFNTGGRYDPTTDSWTPTSTAGAPLPRYLFTAVWTGTEMVVWGGFLFNTNDSNTGGRYNPANDTWTPTSTTGAPAGRSNHSAVWTGSLMIVWGGRTDASFPIRDTGARYDPATDTWTATAAPGAPAARYDHTAIWTGSVMIIWGGTGTDHSVQYLNTGARYDPASDSWTPTATSGVPAGRSGHTAVWTGSLMVAWGGFYAFYDSTSHYSDTGGRYDPATDSWLATSTAFAPTPRQFHTAVWTGQSMIVWGGLGGQYCDTGGRYDPVSDTWTPTSTTGAPSGRFSHSAVWTGNRLVIFSGFDGTANPSTGARYDPVSDIWTPISTTGAPTPRYRHTAAWTGSRMVVWGGYSPLGSILNSGGRYDPGSDSWAPTSLLGAPVARYHHTAVWTGSSMVVWGGTVNSAGSIVPTNTGGRYDPVSDSWSATSTTGAPTARVYHSAIWAGSQMLVWGGRNGANEFDTGARYSPATDIWVSTSTMGAPFPRDSHTAVWTGSLMIVWGGWPALTSGGRYFLGDPDDGDGDGFTAAEGDCNDDDATAYPGAPQLCDGRNDNCSDPSWPAVPANEADADGDGFRICSGDCDDTRAAVRPGAPQICDGVNDNCTDPTWPMVPANEADADGDGFGICAGDCDDTRAAIHPGAADICDSIDNNCDGQVDEDPNDLDSDSDSVRNACDNCPLVFNPEQVDVDGDQVGDLCDDCQSEFNPSQSDFDDDNQGDVCDLNDGLIYVYSTDKNFREWQTESGYTSWNSYRGSLSVLRATGQYTQAPGSNALAGRDCGLAVAYVLDPLVPAPGEVAFNLVTGVAGGVENSLGTNSAEVPRANANPCP